MHNDQLAQLFDEMADLTQLKGGDDFRAQSYRTTARSLRQHPRAITEMLDRGEPLTVLPGVGKSNAGKILEMLKKGSCARLEEVRGLVPSSLLEVLRIPDLGAVTVRRLWQELGITSRDELRQAAEDGRLCDLKGMSPAAEQRLLSNLDSTAERGSRRLRHEVRQDLVALRALLNDLTTVKRWEVAGEIRRRAETVSGVSVLLQCDDWPAVTAQLRGWDEVRDAGPATSSSLTLTLFSGLRITVHHASADIWAAQLLHLTGSAAHLRALPGLAEHHGLSLTRDGLLRDGVPFSTDTETELYDALGLSYIPPELREGTAEVDAAASNSLPALLEHRDIRAELHCHTTASDGTASIEAMALAARERGLTVLAITDHSKSTVIANGLTEDRLRRHTDEIREVNARLDGIEVLAGVEVDILKDGRLDFDSDLLMSLDYVVASVHSAMRQPEAQVTERVLRAIHSGLIHAIGHPTGRKIDQRDPLELDLDAIFAACAETGVRLEINGQPDRLDLPWDQVQAAKAAGVRFVLGSDAHSTQTVSYLDYCVDVARRGWLSADDVLNAQPTDTILDWIHTFRTGVAS